MKTPRWVALSGLFLATVSCVPAWSQNQGETRRAGRPGTVNYVEGQAAIGDQELNAQSVGSAELANGQSLTTQDGKVEILLTPGVVLRVADHSAVKMISADLANTEVEVDQGRALVEVADIHKENNIRVDENGVSTKLLQKGLYDFDAAHNQVRVFKGKAEVYADHKITLTGDHQVTLDSSGKLSAKGFDSRQYEDDFYRWSGLRAGYLSEANIDAARSYVNAGPGWYGPGWYWDAGFGSYTFIPGSGIFYSPFGWSYYSPFAIYGSPYFYYGYGGGYYGGVHRFGEFHGPYGHGVVPEGGFRGGAFRGGGGAIRGGGGMRGGGGGSRGGGGGRR